MATKDDKDLYQTLGALLESSKDVKDELKFIHKSIIEDRAAVKELVKDLVAVDSKLDDRIRSLEKKTYTIWIVASAAWTAVVAWLTK